MKLPHVTYKYDLERDIDDIEIGLNTIRNGRKPDNELALLIGQYCYKTTPGVLGFN
ncbi:MAG: hypothetical protein UX31_C0006G0048 [Candidatus Nomurabacteria bacterium GW2011_GWA1_46_11]|uniref:Uncharacterized protein n=1 Tax=Candidatus Nomurabacteria bacterium GW2011_GWA1_46_11 TaxID=1618732 RepID=A0A0G1NP21_9BACT|nr:MAG: hypothetical protein UX31_C0006G0048 [Candidatus Nomurabacteria bacterium GW2011_GWA1_46_11]